MTSLTESTHRRHIRPYKRKVTFQNNILFKYVVVHAMVDTTLLFKTNGVLPSHISCLQFFKTISMFTSADICLATSEVIGRDSMDADFDQVVEYLNDSVARGVVVFASEHDTERLLAAVQRANLVGRFNWVGSDDWGNKYTPVENFKEVAEGAITLSHSADQDVGKDATMKFI